MDSLRIMSDNEQNEKWKTNILILNGWRVRGHWYKLELQNAMGLWAIALHQSLKTSKQCLSSMTSIFYSSKADNNIPFVCKSHYADCLINELGIDNSLGNPTYTPTTPTKEEIRTIIGLLYIPLHFQSKKKNWIYRLSTGNWQLMDVKNETLQPKIWFQFSNCELSLYKSQHYNSIWRIYLSVDMIFQSLWFLLGFPW